MADAQTRAHLGGGFPSTSLRPRIRQFPMPCAMVSESLETFAADDLSPPPALLLLKRSPQEGSLGRCQCGKKQREVWQRNNPETSPPAIISCLSLGVSPLLFSCLHSDLQQLHSERLPFPEDTLQDFSLVCLQP